MGFSKRKVGFEMHIGLQDSSSKTSQIKDGLQSPTKARAVIAGTVILVIAVLCALVGYWYGQHRVRSRYEIWWSTSGAFERESVRAAKMAAILAEYQTVQTTNSREVLILGELRTSLGILDSFVPLASEPDRKLASRLARSVADQIASFAPTNSTFPTYRESHRGHIYREIQETLDSILQKSTNGAARL
jgi:hypothetical protein